MPSVPYQEKIALRLDGIELTSSTEKDEDSDMEGVMVVLETPRQHKQNEDQQREQKSESKEKEIEKKEEMKERKREQETENNTEGKKEEEREARNVGDKDREEEKEKEKAPEEVIAEGGTDGPVPQLEPKEDVTDTGHSAVLARARTRRKVLGGQRQDIIQRPASMHAGSSFQSLPSIPSVGRRRLMSPPLDLTRTGMPSF